MAGWLGIGVLVAFSLGLALFMRLEPGRVKSRQLPQLGLWRRCAADRAGPANDKQYCEERFVVIEGRGLRRHQLVEQRRLRNVDTGDIVEVVSERVVDAWWQL